MHNGVCPIQGDNFGPYPGILPERDESQAAVSRGVVPNENILIKLASTMPYLGVDPAEEPFPLLDGSPLSGNRI